MLVRQAYTPISTDIESEPFKDPIETEKTQSLSPRAAPLSPDYTPTSPDYTLDTPHTDEESEPMEASETRTASPSDSTSPISLNHPLTQTSPTPTPSQAFYYRSTVRMAVHTQPTLLLGYSAKFTKAMTLSPSSFHKKYWGTSEPILDTETEVDELNAKGTGSKSEESEDEGPGLGTKEATSEDQQHQAVLVEDIAANEPLGLGYKVARRRALELAEGPVPSTFEVDLEDDTVYLDIEFDPPARAPVQTLASPEWSFGSLIVSPASLTVPSPVASPVTTPAATIVVSEDEFIEVGAQLKLHGSILHDHTQCLDALPPTIFVGYGLGARNEDMSRLLLHSVPYGDQFWPSRPGQDRQTPREQLCGRLGTDIAKIARKRSKPDKHGHETKKSVQ
ncbi:hypothetical protein Tco_1357462 [Tanacetum coccineum]